MNHGIAPHCTGKHFDRNCSACISLTGFVRHYECQRCFLMVPWCNGAADKLDEQWGGICDDCAASVTRGIEP